MNDVEGVILPARLRTMQIVASALMAGVLMFMAFALVKVLVLDAGRLAVDTPLMSFLALGFFAMTAPISFVMPRVITQAALRQLLAGDWQAPQGADPRAYPTVTAKLLAIYQASMIIGLGMLEGCAFFALIAYIVEGQHWVLGVAAAAIALMGCRFPTEPRVRAWLDQQADELAALRQAATS
jgi:hypothetical protein